MDEKFSAFLDNEATRDESVAVINALLRDDELRASWARQHRIRDALRACAGDPRASIDADFSVRVMQAIRDDAGGGYAGRSLHPERAAAANDTTVVAMPHRGRHRRWWRNMAGLAVAASAAGFALLATQPLQRLQTVWNPAAVEATTPSTRPPAAGTGDAAGSKMNALASWTDDIPALDMSWLLASDSTPNAGAAESQSSADHWAVSDPTLASRLNDYLVEHSGLARGYGLSATTPGFVRVATYGQGTW